jgi:KOW motif-containing protein
MSLNPGDKVRVIAGPYTGWEAVVLRIEDSLQRVTVVVTVLGRSAAIELRPSQIEPYSDSGTSHTGQWDSLSDPDAPVRDPRRSGPGGRNSAISIVEPEAEEPADATAGIAHLTWPRDQR